MSKVFRLYNIQGNNNITDWQEAKVYGTQAISEITDPEGADAKKEITSIPSPFARIDLIKTAFKEVVTIANRSSGDKEYAPFDGKTIYHKMVSETLDVAEIFFNYERFKNFFEIIIWDRAKDLDRYSVFGKTLKRYLESDATRDDPYNFGKLHRIYMLNYTGPDRPSNLNIVGATSPATLFFSSANNLSYVSRNIAIGQDRPFDDSYQPLFKRDFEFQKYLYAFRKNYGEGQFHRDFPEIDDYLTSSAGKICNYKYLTQQQKDQVDALTANSINDYEPIMVGDRGQDIFDILGKPFHKKPSTANWKSDFAIRSGLYGESKKPLVLPVEKGNTYEKLKFTTDVWGKDNKAPYEDDRPFMNRILPVVRDEYPYLTISDFLSWEIVRMPYEIDSLNFFDGNINRANGNSYLLPLTDTFFKFFTVKDLQGTVEGGKKMFELLDMAPQNVRAVLRIPVQKGYIEYSRTYFAEMEVDKDGNDGAVIENKIGLGIMPLIRFPETVKKHYRIAMFDKGKNDAVLTCIDDDRTVESKQVVRAKKDLSGRGCSHESYIVEENFDRIKVEIGNNREISAYIVPKFKTDEGNAQYIFAIDFGTTNTHIEYCTNTNTSPVAFDIKTNERQLNKLHTHYTDPDIRVGFVQEFIPDTIGDKDVYSFPMRTVFAQHKNVKYEQSPMPLADGHIPFLYEKDFTPMWNDIKTELKWGGVHERLLEMHLETIFILTRNKVVLNGGNLADTKVVWFYPASMTEAKVNQFKKNWKAAYEKYFGENTKNIISISESKAPYIHFVETQGAAPEVVTIDVGGGTTDVFIVEGEEDKMLLSFRFASNAIFGDGYNSNPGKNGFVRKYKKQFEEILKNNNLQELSQALSQIEQQNKSSDIIAFLFSLIGDKVKNNPELNFLQKLSNDDRLRYVFIVFYASIFYFIAKSMKAKGLKKPKTMAFSGNGAHSLRIVSDEMDMIERFVKLIFDGVYGNTGGSIEVMMEKNPKIATCKGGIKKPVSQDYETINNIKTILAGNDLDTFSDKRLTYADITEDVQNAVVQSVKDFFIFLFDLHSNNNDFLSSKLAAEPAIFNQVKEFILGEKGEQLLSVSMFKGLKNKRQEVNDETKLEETLFFYPLVGVLHDLALEITEM